MPYKKKAEYFKINWNCSAPIEQRKVFAGFPGFVLGWRTMNLVSSTELIKWSCHRIVKILSRARTSIDQVEWKRHNVALLLMILKDYNSTFRLNATSASQMTIREDIKYCNTFFFRETEKEKFVGGKVV